MMCQIRISSYSITGHTIYESFSDKVCMISSNLLFGSVVFYTARPCYYSCTVIVDYNDSQKQSLVLPGSGIDLEFETDVKSISPDAAQYETLYVTAHKGPCRTGVFHPRGVYHHPGVYWVSTSVFTIQTNKQ